MSDFLSSFDHLNIDKEWKQLHKKDFIKMTTGFMEELELPEAKPRVETYESFFQQGPENPAAS